MLFILAFIGQRKFLGVNTLMQNYLRNVLVLGSVMWFLPVMFISVCLFLILEKKQKLNFFVSVISIILGLVYPVTNSLIVDILLKALIGYGFITIGYWMSGSFSEKFDWKIILCLIPVHLILTFSNGTVSLAGRQFNNCFIYLSESVMGTFILYQIAMRIPEKCMVYRLLAKFGYYSVVVLCTHQLIIDILRIFDYKMGELLPRLGIAEGIVLTTCVMTVIGIGIPAIIKFFGWSFGLNKK